MTTAFKKKIFFRIFTMSHNHFFLEPTATFNFYKAESFLIGRNYPGKIIFISSQDTAAVMSTNPMVEPLKMDTGRT
jgi:hypothetical protein